MASAGTRRSNADPDGPKGLLDLRDIRARCKPCFAHAAKPGAIRPRQSRPAIVAGQRWPGTLNGRVASWPLG